MHVLSTLLLLFALFYCIIMLRFAWGFRRIVRPERRVVNPPTVSVVVAARDEEVSIRSCLEAIAANRYPDYEIIVVDDFSTDGTLAEAEQVRATVPQRIRVLALKNRMDSNDAGKVGAIEAGIGEAKGDVILTTDADCLVGPRWIETMVLCMQSPVSFVSGPVLFDPDPSWHARLQALEFLGLIAVGAGGIGAGIPNMCNSANIAYRRSVGKLATSSAAPSSTPSDEVLLQLLHRQDPHSVTFCASLDAVVRTEPVGDLRGFLHQRMRWAGNGARYPSKRLLAIIGGIYLFYVLLLIGMLTLFVQPMIWPAVAAALGLKILVEAALLIPAATHFEQADLLWWLVPGQLLQVPYVVFIGLAGAVGGSTWKDRRTH